jgi:hypothetical protein
MFLAFLPPFLPTHQGEQPALQTSPRRSYVPFPAKLYTRHLPPNHCFALSNTSGSNRPAPKVQAARVYLHGDVRRLTGSHRQGSAAIISNNSRLRRRPERKFIGSADASSYGNVSPLYQSNSPPSTSPRACTGIILRAAKQTSTFTVRFRSEYRAPTLASAFPPQHINLSKRHCKRKSYHPLPSIHFPPITAFRTQQAVTALAVRVYRTALCTNQQRQVSVSHSLQIEACTPETSVLASSQPIEPT